MKNHTTSLENLQSRPKSAALFAASSEVIPGGVNSPARSFRSVGFSPPLIVSSGKGSLIYDVDGREYIDYCGSWGALILGHAHPDVVQAVQRQMTLGSSFGIATEVEYLFAQKLTQMIPSMEKVRCVSSGTEATMTAMRLARGYTERMKIVKFTGHYHGHSDSLLIQAGSGVASLSSATSKGVSPHVIADTICIPFNDVQAVQNLFNSPLASEIAGVILEPVTGNMGVVLPDPNFLNLLKKETKRIGALLIFDEVMTGFRVSLECAQGLYQIDPDLTCLGKIIGGGFPLAAIGGKKEIMDFLAPLGPVYQAGTLSGNPIATRAGLTTLQLIQHAQFHPELEKKTKSLTGPMRALFPEAAVQECGSMFSIFFGLEKVSSKEDLKNLDEAKFRHLFAYLFEKGIYIPPHSQEAWFMSGAHTQAQIDYTLECLMEFSQNS